MQRGLIRRRWQVTIPRGIRQRLNLFIGQTLNWEIIEEDTGVEIRIMTGTFCKRLEEMAAFQEPLARKKRKAAAQKKRSSSAKVFGISDVMKGLKGQKQAIGILSELVATVQKSLEESQNENKTRKKRAEKTSPG